MITLSNISKKINNEVLFEKANFTINTSEKVAIVGKNGVGKSTLMKIIYNDDLSTTGTVTSNSGTKGILSQEVFNSLENSLSDELEKIDINLYNLQKKIVSSQKKYDQKKDEKSLNEYIELVDKFTHLGGYERKHQIQKLMTNFGFDTNDLQKKVKEFSGGQRTVLSLIKLLLIEPDYLFLDEPTNHLDIEKIKWLEDYLKSYQKTIIVISHDRYFIDNVCTKIIEIENKTIEVYKSNFTNYLAEKETRYLYNLANYNSQQQEISKLEDFIERFRNKPTKVGQVNDRKHKLENLDILQKPVKINETIEFQFKSLSPKKATYIELIATDIGYDESLLKDVNFRLFSNEKIAIIGKNATGKSTLLKSMLKEIPLLKGQIILHQSLKIGYFSQDIFNNFEDYQVYNYAKELMGDVTSTQVRKQLAKFLFKGDDVFKNLSDLSGGELVRLNLLNFSLNSYDLLILDEPTNHLDIASKTILEDALCKYEGSILCVSHDRFFLNQIFKNFVYLENKKIHEFTGEYGNYEQFIIKDDLIDNLNKHNEPKVDHKKLKRINTMKVKKIENAIIKLEEKILTLNSQLEVPDIYNDWKKVEEIKKKLENLTIELEILFVKYEEEIDE